MQSVDLRNAVLWSAEIRTSNGVWGMAYLCGTNERIMKILAGNWKMNTTFEEGYTLIEALKTELSPERLGEVVVVLAPPVVQLTQAIDLLIDYPE
ncbi:MAG: Triosephosphate isomerase, partial [Bacteroidota bacterium]